MSKEYIVYLKGNVTPAVMDNAIKDVESAGTVETTSTVLLSMLTPFAAGGTINHRYTSVLKGFSASMPESHFERLKASSKEIDSDIGMIEPTVEMTIDG
ncbi:hypothetical protein FRC12_020365 [Ceratobasidium sp. 428]|nr:hypothetical protein FRC12_020365 [Ceratobasidium sp. 428]